MKLLKFAASWCGPCQGLKITIQNLEDKITIPIEDIDIDTNTDLAVQYGVRSVPTLVIVDDSGTEIKRSVGALTADKLLDFLKV